jgi:hypothetical protein
MLCNAEISLETQYADAIIKGGASINQLISKCNNKNAGQEIYGKMHQQGGYLDNNWGFDLLRLNIIDEYASVFELGAGNGRLIDYINKSTEVRARGVDLINPSKNQNIFTKSVFELTDIDLGNTGLVISSDFLEHLSLSNLSNLFNEDYLQSKDQLHTIALYDDGVSHETILYPSEWILFFSNFYNNVKIIDIKYRRSRFNKKAITIFATNNNDNIIIRK